MSEYRAAPTSAMPHLPAPAVFLGALASEVNEPDELAPAFVTLADVTERLVAAVRAGSVDEAEAAGHLRSLRLTDSAGAVWTVGATSLRWYRKSERGWKLAVPPTVADDAHRQSLSDALDLLPEELLTRLGGVAAEVGAGGYAADPFATDALAPAKAWEFELGDDRKISYGS